MTPPPRPASSEHPGISALFRPRGVAIVGVSGREGSLTSRPLRYLLDHGFRGGVYPVNPRYSELMGLRCYPSLADLPEPVDLVLVSVPASTAARAVREAGAIGASAAVVFGSGFAEVGQEGRALQDDLVRAAEECGVRILGPNCQGVIYRPSGLTATFTSAAARPPDGRSGVAYVGQSGAVGGSVLDLASEMGLALTAWVSTGNQADLTLTEVATELISDDAVDVVMLYAEALGDGFAFTRLARHARARGKQVVVLRSGLSAVGRRASESHTGSMLGDEAGFLATARQYGVVVVDDIDELLYTAAVLQAYGPVTGRRLGVITSSGGAGGIAADHADASGFRLLELAAETKERLREHVPSFGSVNNPVDVTAQLFNEEAPDIAVRKVCDAVASDPEVDAVVVVMTMITGVVAEQIADGLGATIAAGRKPVYVVWLAGTELTSAGRARFRRDGVPVFASVGSLMRILARLARSYDAPGVNVSRPPRSAAAGVAAPAGGQIGDGSELDLAHDVVAGRVAGDRLLEALGIGVPRSRLATSPADATRAARALGADGAPVVMKLQAPSVSHKSDVGGVRLSVAADDAATAFDEIAAAAAAHGVEDVEGILVQETVSAGVELLIGAVSRADGWAPTISVGIGGVAAEIYADIVTEAAPVSTEVALDMLRRLRGWPLLDGFRGTQKVDVVSAALAVSAVSVMIAALSGTAAEVEINPLILAPGAAGGVAVDLLVRSDDASTG